MVVLVHREAAFEKDSRGGGGLIVAENRNGPTDTITVPFWGRFWRFADMASGTGLSPSKARAGTAAPVATELLALVNGDVRMVAQGNWAQ